MGSDGEILPYLMVAEIRISIVSSQPSYVPWLGSGKCPKHILKF